MVASARDSDQFSLVGVVSYRVGLVADSRTADWHLGPDED
jgi:hypothetical protein